MVRILLKIFCINLKKLIQNQCNEQLKTALHCGLLFIDTIIKSGKEKKLGVFFRILTFISLSFSLSLTILLEFIYRLLKNCIGKTNFWRNIFLKRITTVNGFWAENRGGYWFCQIIYYNQGHASVFQNFAFLNFLIIILCKLIEMNSESFYEYEQQWVIFFSFLSSFFFFFFFNFFAPVQGYSAKVKLVSPYVSCFYKWRYLKNIILQTLPPKMFLSNISKILLNKSH